MKLQYALFAENADRFKDSRLCLFGADFDTFHVPEVPIALPFHLVAKVVFDETDGEKVFQAWLEVVNPLNERKPFPVPPLALKLSEPMNFQDARLRLSAVHFRLAVNFQHAGIYRFFLMVESVELACLPLNIVLTPDTESEARQSVGPAI